MKNACITGNNCCITVKFGAKVAYDKPIPHAKEIPEISTDAIDNDVITLKFEHFHQKAPNFQ